MTRINHYPCIPLHLKIFRRALGLPVNVPKLPNMKILLELRDFILNNSRSSNERITEGIEKALKNGSIDLKKYLIGDNKDRPNHIYRPDHIANALHAVLPKELHGEIEIWVSEIFWEQDWEYENKKTLEKIQKDAQGFLEEEISKKATASLMEEIGSMPGGCRNFLEAGFGAGDKLIALADKLPDVHFYGIDLLQSSVNGLNQKIRQLEQKIKLRKKPVASQGDMFHMSFGNNTFDITYNMGVLEHYKEQDQLSAIREMARVTRRGGRVLIGVPNKLSPSKVLQMGITGVNWRDVKDCNSYRLWAFRYEAPMSRTEMTSMFEKAGLRALGFRGWDPFRKICRDEEMRANLKWLLNGSKPFPGMVAAWDWINDGNKAHADRWLRIQKLEFTRLGLFTLAMYYMGWLGQKLIVNPADKLTDKMISNYFGHMIMIIAEKTVH